MPERGVLVFHRAKWLRKNDADSHYVGNPSPPRRRPMVASEPGASRGDRVRPAAVRSEPRPPYYSPGICHSWARGHSTGHDRGNGAYRVGAPEGRSGGDGGTRLLVPVRRATTTGAGGSSVGATARTHDSRRTDQWP